MNSQVLTAPAPLPGGAPTPAPLGRESLPASPTGGSPGLPITADVSVFDPRELMDRLECDEEMAASIFAEFAEDLPRLLEGLRRQIACRALPEATRQAHTIKGAAATVGASELSAVALEAERAGQGGSVDALAAVLPRLETASLRLLSALRKSGWAPTVNP